MKILLTIRLKLARLLIGKEPFISGFLITGKERYGIYYPLIGELLSASEAGDIAALVPLRNIKR